jgi:hypothetical protein
MHVLPKCISDTFIPLFSFVIIDPSSTDEVVSEQSFEENIYTAQERK